MDPAVVLTSLFTRPVLTPEVVTDLNSTFSNLKLPLIAPEVTKYAESLPSNRINAILSLTSLLIRLLASCQQFKPQAAVYDAPLADYLARSSLAYVFLLWNRGTIFFDPQMAPRRPQYHGTTANITVIWEHAVLQTLEVLRPPGVVPIGCRRHRHCRVVDGWDFPPFQRRHVDAVLSWKEWGGTDDQSAREQRTSHFPLSVGRPGKGTSSARPIDRGTRLQDKGNEITSTWAYLRWYSGLWSTCCLL